MNRTLCFALPALLMAACGDSGNTEPQTPDAGKPDAGKKDAPPASPDVLDKLDLTIAPTNPDVAYDAPVSPDLPTMSTDAPPAVEHLGPGLDGPDLKLDAPAPIDGPAWTIDWDTPHVQPVDGPASPTDAQTQTMYSPDGRTWTVVVVDACRTGSQPDRTTCPATYSEGLAKVLGRDGGGSLSETGAGRCLEGSYVYFPYLSTSSVGCYYDASTQRLVASAQYNDTLSECGQDGTASYTFASGQCPVCSKITWEARNHL